MLPRGGRRRVNPWRRRSITPVLLDVLVEDVDLPERPVGIVDPELRLARVTAFDALFALRPHSCRFEAPLHVDELFGGSHAETDMIQMAARLRLARNQR